MQPLCRISFDNNRKPSASPSQRGLAPERAQKDSAPDPRKNPFCIGEPVSQGLVQPPKTLDRSGGSVPEWAWLSVPSYYSSPARTERRTRFAGGMAPSVAEMYRGRADNDPDPRFLSTLLDMPPASRRKASAAERSYRR